MTLEEAIKLVKECSKCKYVKVSEYADAYLFEVEDGEIKNNDGIDAPVVLKETGDVIGLTAYILETYRDLEDDLIREYDVINYF